MKKRAIVLALVTLTGSALWWFWPLGESGNEGDLILDGNGDIREGQLGFRGFEAERRPVQQVTDHSGDPDRGARCLREHRPRGLDPGAVIQFGWPKPDHRVTLDWQPSLPPDTSGKAKFSFYNSDVACDLDIVIEGLSKDGQPISAVFNH